MFVAPRNSVALFPMELEVLRFCIEAVIITKTLLEVADGVIDAVMFVSVSDVDVTVVAVVIVAETTCKILPPAAGVAHFNPVAVDESAVRT